jgi:hypothetical protein
LSHRFKIFSGGNTAILFLFFFYLQDVCSFYGIMSYPSVKFFPPWSQQQEQGVVREVVGMKYYSWIVRVLYQIPSLVSKARAGHCQGSGRHEILFMDCTCSARDWDGKDYLRIIPRVVW